MFIGHFGLSFAAKKAAPRVSLGWLFMATQFVDILWPLLLVLHVEKVTLTAGYTKMNAFNFLYYPYTHSLLMGIVWGVVVGAIYWLKKKDKQGSIVIGLCVLSHWFLDLIVHTADLPLTPFGEQKVGLGLWNHVAAELVLEMVIFLTGTYIYANFTKAKNRIGSWGLAALVTLLLAIHLSNTFGPAPPDSVTVVFIASTILMTVLISLAWWVDKNRTHAARG